MRPLSLIYVLNMCPRAMCCALCLNLMRPSEVTGLYGVSCIAERAHFQIDNLLVSFAWEITLCYISI